MTKKRAYTGRAKKIKYGVGVVPKEYKTYDTESGWFCPYYRRWHTMIQRCYSERMNKERPTYERVTVCDEWHDFLTFRDWMEKQDWEGKDLDKDVLGILTGKSEYSPDNCAFISRELNSYFTLRQNHRGPYPLGVTYSNKTGKYVARLNKPTGRVSLGRFNTPEEAHKAYQLAKYNYGLELLKKQTDNRVIAAMHVMLHKLGESWAANRETISLTT